MSDIKQAFGAPSQAITLTLASLASAAFRECTVVDNSANNFMDALLYLAIKLQAGAPTGEKVIKVFFYCSEDGANFTDNATGADAGITPRSPSNFLGPWLIQAPTTGGLTYKAIVPVAQFFGGVLPPKWGIIVQNATGQTFSATEGDHTKEYRGVYQTVA